MSSIKLNDIMVLQVRLCEIRIDFANPDFFFLFLSSIQIGFCHGWENFVTIILTKCRLGLRAWRIVKAIWNFGLESDLEDEGLL